MATIWIETRSTEKIAWVHTDDPGIKSAYARKVPDSLYEHLKANPLDSDDPMSELLQVGIQLGYDLGG